MARAKHPLSAQLSVQMLVLELRVNRSPLMRKGHRMNGRLLVDISKKNFQLVAEIPGFPHTQGQPRPVPARTTRVPNKWPLHPSYLFIHNCFSYKIKGPEF